MGGKAAPPPPVVPPPKVEDPEVQQATKEALARRKRAQGYRGTLLTEEFLQPGTVAYGAGGTRQDTAGR